MRLLFSLSLLIFLFSNASAQKVTLNGKVMNAGRPLPSATLQLKTADSTILAYASTGDDGLFVLEADLSGTKLAYLIASYIGLKKDTLFLESSAVKGNTLSHNFDLVDDPRQLEQINIKAEKPVVTSRDDTTRYNVARLTTAADKNIESVIRKMPGMSVSKDGTITYNQRKITKVLLAGDDMTGENYKTITQNMKPQLVEEVQAIENYVEDDLLNGIISSDEVVLNLKLKQSKSVVGNADLGLGSNKRDDLSATVISLYQSVKSFTYLSHNNTGKYQEDLLSLNDKTGYNPNGTLLNHTIADTNPFDNNHFRLNNTLSGSFSAVSRVNKNLKLTLGLYAIRNKLFDDRANNQIFFGPQAVTVTDRESRFSNAKNYQMEWGAQQRLGKSARLSAGVSYTAKPSTYGADAVSFFNNQPGNLVNQYQNDDIKTFKGNITYLQKTNAATAFILNLNTISQKTGQSYSSISDLYQQVPLFNGAKHLLQEVSNSATLVNLDAQLLKKSGDNYFYLNGGSSLKEVKTLTNLFRIDDSGRTPLGDDFKNNVALHSQLLYLAAKYTFDNRAIKLQALVRANARKVRLYQQDSLYFYLQPELNLTARLSNTQQLYFSYKLDNSASDDNDYYNNYVFTDVRNLDKGLSRFYNFYTHHLRAYYNNKYFAENYFSFQLSGNGSYSASGFLTSNYFDNTIFYTEKSFYKGIKRMSGNALLQKFVPVLATDFTLNGGLSRTNYYGSVGSQVNPYSNLSRSLDFKLSTGFNLPINFSGQFQYINESTFLSGNQINHNVVYKYSASSRIKYSRAFTHLVSFDLYQLNKTDYRILNSELIYQPKNTRVKYSITGNNLFNVKRLVNTYVSNVVQSTSSASLLGRYILFNVSLSLGNTHFSTP